MSHNPKSGVFELFTSKTKPQELRVLEWTSTEEICGINRVDLVVSCSQSMTEDLAGRLLGQHAAFAMHSNDFETQARRGIIVDARVESSRESDAGRIHIGMASRLALMDLRINSRIFQDHTIPEILESIFKDWQLPFAFRFVKTYAKRVYCTQYQETDLAFVTRLCAKEGLGFFLEHPTLDDKETTKPGSEKIIVFDHQNAYAQISAVPRLGAPHTLVHSSEKFAEKEHHVKSFGLERRVLPEFSRLGEFDFRKPRLPLRAQASLQQKDRTPIGEELGGEKLAHYRHSERGELEQDPKIAGEIDEAIAQLRLSQLRRDLEIGKASSRCTRLAPGYRFTLEEHPSGSLNQDYVVTRITHKGKIPEAGGDEPTYTNTFECVPATVVYRPHVPSARIQQAMETAIVVGPGGNDIHCDEHGRVKVQFHWDLDGKSDETSSCWLRTTQPWVGTNWGSQFIPRIGTEVLVGFVAGDVDRPVIMGSLYNAVRPWPFRLPAEARKAGFRTQAVPGGATSELVFDDEKGKEMMLLKAQRDFSQVVENNYDLTVKKGETVRVEGRRNHTIEDEAKTTVKGSRIDKIKKDFSVDVEGSHDFAVSGNADIRVTGNRTTRIEGREKMELQKEVDTTYLQDQTVRVLGHLITVVGQHDARRSATVHVEGSANYFTTGTTEITSEKDIVLRVGENSIRLTPDGLELVAKKITVHTEEMQTEAKEKILFFAKKQVAFKTENLDVLADKKIKLKGEGSQVQLDQNARVDGATVKLNCAPDPVDPLEAPEYEAPKVTKIKLADDEGNPLPGRRYVVVGSDGAERSGVLDENGEAEVYLLDEEDEAEIEVFFPDVDNPREG